MRFCANFLMKSLALLVVCLCSCSLDPVLNDIDGEYFVICRLTPSQPKHQVMISLAYPERLPDIVADAKVTLSSKDQKVNLQHVGNGVYDDSNEPINVRPGDTYYLNVLLPNGQIATGKTELPGNFSILFPPEGDTLKYPATAKPDTLNMPKIKWSASEKAFFYQLSIKSDNDGLDFNGFEGVETQKTEAYMPEIMDYYKSEIDLSIVYKAYIDIIARDSTAYFTFRKRLYLGWVDFTYEEYRKFLLQGELTFTPKPHQTSIDGCYGTFNGFVTAQKDVYVKFVQ